MLKHPGCVSQKRRHASPVKFSDRINLTTRDDDDDDDDDLHALCDSKHLLQRTTA